MPKLDAVIILGGGTDGTLQPVLYTKERLSFFLKRKDLLRLPIIVSGGYPFRVIEKPRYTEAEVMKHFLVRRGIPVRNIYLEKKSRETIANAYYSKQVIKRHPQWKKIAVITSQAHILRARWVFKMIFGNAYRFVFIGPGSKVGTIGKNLVGRKKYEKHVLKIYKEEFKSIKKGDDRNIANLLKHFHPDSRSQRTKKIAKKVTDARQKFLQ
jgi:uncharacterized SAM-binding protein YcdF (DUF218 family)